MIISTRLFRLLASPLVVTAAITISHSSPTWAVPAEPDTGSSVATSGDNASGTRCVTFGLDAGVCFSRLCGDDPDFDESGLSTKAGFAAGFFVRKTLKGAFGIESDIMFVAKGYEWGEGNGIDGSVSAKYVEIPMLLTYDVMPSKGIHPRQFAGTYLGILISAKAGYELDGISRSADVKGVLNNVDWGASLGAAANIPFWGSAISLESRFELSLADLLTGGSYTDDQGLQQHSAASTMKLHSLTLLVGYCF